MALGIEHVLAQMTRGASCKAALPQGFLPVYSLPENFVGEKKTRVTQGTMTIITHNVCSQGEHFSLWISGQAGSIERETSVLLMALGARSLRLECRYGQVQDHTSVMAAQRVHIALFFRGWEVELTYKRPGPLHDYT
jgi:hypothetical protein